MIATLATSPKMGEKKKKKKNTLEGKGHMSNDYGSVKSALVQAFLKGPLLLDT
jgi:hypothetical protein